MANIGYPLDVSGSLPENLVSETRTLSAKAIDGRAFIIPKAAPFFADNVKVFFNGVALVEGVDFINIIESEELSHTIERKICAGILFNTIGIDSVVLVEAQTVGGNFNLPIGNTVENMAAIIRNPIFTVFSQLVGTPAGLPTWSHIHEWSSTVGYEELIRKLDLLILAINAGASAGDGSSGSLALTALQEHLNAAVAHDKSAVGLGAVNNFSLAQDADYNTKPYPNNKYVTPRSVMYAITRFIGNDLAEINTKIEQLNTALNDNTVAYKDLLLQWENLSSTLNTIDQNYALMQEAVNSYSEAVSRLEIEYRAVAENQQVWNNQLQEMNTTVKQYSKDYETVVKTQDELLEEFEAVKLAYTTFQVTVDKIEVRVKANETAIAALNTHAMYPANKVLTAGSYNFRIKPKEIYSIVLIGAGGGCGEYTTDEAKIGYNYNGENGGSTSLWCLQDIVSGQPTPSAKPLALAGGGFGGTTTYADSNGVINHYGLGGRGGNFIVTEGAYTIEEASVGEGGIKGYGVYRKGILSVQDTGYEYYGAKFGKAGNAEDAIGQGGEGAIVRLRFENKLTTDLDMMVVVGASGRAYSSDRNNANGGLVILSKIK